MRVAIVLMLVASVTSSAIAQSEAPALAVPTRYVLVSWHGPPDCVYVILSEDQFAALVRRVHQTTDKFPARRLLRTVGALEAAIALLPENSTLTWREDPPAVTAFPPKPIIDRIDAYAAAHHIKLEFASPKT